MLDNTRHNEDQKIAHNIAEAFERNPIIDANIIDVKVDHGTVFLSGTLPTWNAILAANETALHTCGVVAVIDALTKRKHD
jgi:osmotically-inducible protein OsmY